MSFRLQGWLSCDGCGARIESGTVSHREQFSVPYSEVKRIAHERNWRLYHPGRKGPRQHFCPQCCLRLECVRAQLVSNKLKDKEHRNAI